VRPSGAFSTLGWFSDPLLSTVIDGDSVSVATTVLHEMAHTALYVPNATPFDESFATFVGYRGAEAFFRSNDDSARAELAAAIWRDQLRLSCFYAWLSDALETAYAAGANFEAARDEIFGEGRERLAGGLEGTLEVYSGARLAQGTLNNASLIAARIYRERLDLFEEIYELAGRDLKRTIEEIAAAVDGMEPYEAMVTLIAKKD
jgi:predicted aminopeptidase